MPPPQVSVVIPCFNQARYLDEAIASVKEQQDPCCEIVVVDDGSEDTTAAVATRHPDVVYVHQRNEGPSAARNTGLRHSTGAYIVFLDADDRLLPGALEYGRRWLDAHPRRAFVSGHYRLIGEDGSVIAEPKQARLCGDPYLELLRGNRIGMHGSVMFRRTALKAVNGTDAGLRSSEDYDLYLRIARNHPIAQHPHVVAEYRRHGANTSGDPARMLRSSLEVLDRQWPLVKRNPEARAAYRDGRRAFRDFYAAEAVEHAHACVERGDWRSALRSTIRLLGAGGLRVVPALLSRSWTAQAWKRKRARTPRPPVGRVRFGHFRRGTPFDWMAGRDRGTPVDRYYIEQFLARMAVDIRGRVLSIGEHGYARRFAAEGAQVEALPGSGLSSTTEPLDPAGLQHLPSESFDCVVMPQVLQGVYDVRAALRAVERTLVPGGVLLISACGFGRPSDSTGRHPEYWSFTPAGMSRLIQECFPGACTEVVPYGSTLTAAASLYGLAAEELSPDELSFHVPQFPVLIAARVRKPEVGEE